MVAGDPSRPATIAGLLEGVATVFLRPRAVGTAAAELLALAKERGATRVVALSAINVDDDPAAQPSRLQGDRNREAEDAAVASGLNWVSLRSASFAANTLQMWAPQLRAGDVVRGPCADFAEPLIHEGDVAEVAARALLDSALVDRELRLTGPQSLPQRELVSIIGDVLGRELRYQEIPAEVFKQGMVARGAPRAFVDALLARYARGVGPAEAVTDEVEKVLGRPARTYADWVAGHTTAFRG